MLSPLREPVYAASARSLSGALAEMERLIGDALFAGYVGYNGRAPGASVKKEEASEVTDRNKSGGDARHTLVAYFEIVELASILGVDRETTNLAIRIFRHTASNTSLRNRNVESLATAAFVSAAERRWYQYQEWLKQKGSNTEPDSSDKNTQSQDSPDSNAENEWPNPPRQLSVAEISNAANLEAHEVIRYLKVVNVALRKQRPENGSSITTHMPAFCERLELPPKTKRLAVGIAEKIKQHKICQRRNAVSVAAATIYLACQLDRFRRTQTEICRVTSLTEVTLRKVYKELIKEQDTIVPEWYKHDEGGEDGNETTDQEPVAPVLVENNAETHQASNIETRDGFGITSNPVPNNREQLQSMMSKNPLDMPAPPPLPPGFSKKLSPPASKSTEKEHVSDGIVNAEVQSDKDQSPGDEPQSQKHPTTDSTAVPNSTPSQHTQSAPMSTSLPSTNAIPTSSAANMNPMLAMMNNPAVHAFASAMSMMPPFMMPPPPPPLPPSNKSVKEDKNTGENGENAKGTKENVSTANQATSNDKIVSTKQDASTPVPTTNPMMMMPPALPNGTDNPMVAMQSMMGMMQAMQAFQAMQQQAMTSQGNQTQQATPWGMMAPFMNTSQPLPVANNINATSTLSLSEPSTDNQDGKSDGQAATTKVTSNSNKNES